MSNLAGLVDGRRRGHGESPLDPIRSQRGASATVAAAASNNLIAVSAGKAFMVDSIMIGIQASLSSSLARSVAVRFSLLRSAVSSAVLFAWAAKKTSATTAGKGISPYDANFAQTGIKGFVIVASTVTVFRLRVSVIGNTCTVFVGGFVRDREPYEASS